MKFISRLEQDIALVRCAHSWDILFTLEINFIFPRNHVIFSIYLSLQQATFIFIFIVKSYSADAVPEKIEVFIDDQKVLVDPGTTILQVNCVIIHYVYDLHFNWLATCS